MRTKRSTESREVKRYSFDEYLETFSPESPARTAKSSGDLREQLRRRFLKIRGAVLRRREAHAKTLDFSDDPAETSAE